VYELLKEQAFLGVVESTRTGGGRGQGSYLEHRLVQDTEIVLKSVLRAVDSRIYLDVMNPLPLISDTALTPCVELPH
jgi:hypothetical protein